MIERFAKLPRSLEEKSRRVRLGPTGVPCLLAHPDWQTPTPCVIWLHGRTAYKELDAGRYQRWLKAGIAACAIDLPGHGERSDEALQSASSTLRVVAQAVGEIDTVVAALAQEGPFDTARLGLGGMSAGGMVTLRRLCEAHPFVCASIEGATGSLDDMPGYRERHGEELVDSMNALRHLGGWRHIPLLALHSEADMWVPVAGVRRFIAELQQRATQIKQNPDDIRLVTWPETGAPYEHLGFGKVANEAKNLQTAFYRHHLLGPDSSSIDEESATESD